MKAVFLTKVVNGCPVLPPFNDPDGGPQLYYNLDIEGQPQGGGYSFVGPVEKGAVIVIVDAPPETIDAMRKDAKYQEVSLAKEAAICASQKMLVEDYKKLLASEWSKDLQVVAEITK